MERLRLGRVLLSLLCFAGLSVLHCDLAFAQAINPYVLPYMLPTNQAMISELYFSQAFNMTLPKPIFKQWLHSREEDEGGVMVYRPIDFAFPPARGREGFEFRENGEFINLGIGPTDRRQASSGRWTLKQPGVVEIDLPGQQASYQLIIVECNEQVLKVRKASGG
ncbi:hypothetical protein [Leptolyngbya sp. FACHB-261]|uniref:hypothetical protein n=1 Tax=Leptolyngbya sp. FACHB-261 TaxID=2692806 RepID=UPI001685DCAD|nr:hypothetical protein [Leptolyngbya sp. FACHB-261]MBD2099963.1 hypothetical protein [Leptolyngbya sp. FACHB-261]